MSKDKDKRLEEKEKWDAEAERSLAVARFKKAHKEIEDTEKGRKRPALRSICRRIDHFSKDLLTSAKICTEPKYSSTIVDEKISIMVQNYEESYKSIRFDLQKTLEIKDEDMEKLFPIIEISKINVNCLGSSLINVVSQLSQMRIYCERVLG
jgi:hypothetical protein